MNVFFDIEKTLILQHISKVIRLNKGPPSKRKTLEIGFLFFYTKFHGIICSGSDNYE